LKYGCNSLRRLSKICRLFILVEKILEYYVDVGLENLELKGQKFKIARIKDVGIPIEYGPSNEP
jgi:hypothetical protein